MAEDVRRALMIAKAVGGRADENDDTWWHGSGSGDLRGGESGLHLGTRAAAEDALNARIGVPAEGSWDGTREYGKTKLAGKNTILERNEYGLSGHNMDAPDEDYYSHEHPNGLPMVSSRGVVMKPEWKPNIAGYRLKGPMSNTTRTPHDDWKANGYMKRALNKGNAKRGYFYRNEGEDSGSISAVVPDDRHIEPIKRAHGGATKEARRALMIARDQRALLRRVANIYPAPGGGMDPSPGGGGYSGPGGGKYIGPSHYATGGKVPLEPGKAAIPKGRVRRFHYTDAKNVPHILKEGIQLSKSTGRRVGDPVAVWSTPNNPYEYSVPNGKALVEFHDNPETYTRNPYASPHSVPPENIMAVHLPWHSHYRYALEEGLTPEDLRGVQGEEYQQAADALERTKRATGGSVPPFKLHSGAAKLIAAKGQKKATPQQYAAMPGIKPDELKHSKFDTLGSKALPREEVIKHLEDNAVPLQESVLRHYEGDYVPHDDVREDDGDSKYHEHQLPGGQNYREVLLHTPVVHTPSPELEKARARAEAATRAFDDALNDQLSSPEDYDPAYTRASAEADEARIALARLERTDKSAAASAGFRGGHWDQPNVLAHVRMSDRVGPKGEKILHLEEAQSDWGQQGRDQGFKTGATQRYEEWRNSALERAKQKLTEKQVPEETIQNFLTAMGMGNRQVGHDNLARFVGEKEHADALWKAHLDNQSAVPSGPYVDNTQKWTDLALKRVLHEAAHGGYDKIVVTPGDEQNKRYDLSSQVKNISYFPDIGYLNAETHDGRGIDHHDVKPEDLAKHIGKEAADRILKQDPQRYEGRGKLGGEFYHELEGDDLKMGGAGMRGYYDNILPKRLQALAQQHDPQAKVQLGGYALKTPQNIEDLPEDEQADYYDRDPSGAQRQVPDARRDLHSLDVTPQMRDSIKQGGFNSFKRGGEVGDDPIKNWQWRPTEDVRNELQLDEIPSHVHKFGEFMDETARRASMHGLTPRDLIKAYAITRSSIGRRALPVETLRQTFPELPEGVEGRVRPEGAMGHWLHTKMGQQYLDDAEAGRVNEEAIAHAQNAMRRFGKVETEPTALRWAAKNLPGMEGRVSELIARAHRGQSSPEEWRSEMRVPGVAASKAGFLASMLGRGDQPTLDARQIILHTGRPTKEAAPILGRKGAADAAVNRLAARQTELGFRHDKSMSPFYQHLAHHAIWDKTAGEETTHDDLMQALRGAKDGGRQDYKKGGAVVHPVAAALRQALPPEAFTDATPSQVRAALEKTVSPFSGDPEHVKEALRIASTFKVPTTTTSPGGYYNISQDRSPEEVSTKLEGLPGVKPKPVRKMSWEDLHKKGGSFINLGGDRSTFGRLSRINGEPLAWPVDLHAGPNYMRELNPGLVWANAPGHATSITNTIRRAADKGPVYGIYAPMGPRAVDSAHHMFDAVMAQIPSRDISKKDAAAFDAEIKKGLHMPLKKRPAAIKALEKWPGVLNAKEASEFARTLPGEQRSGIIQHMDKKSWKDKGFPQIGVTRVAITDPDVFKAPGNMLGHRVVQLDPDKMVEETKFKHGTYSAPTAGEYVGDVPLVQRHYAAPDVIEQRLMKPTVAGDIIHPYSASPVGRSSARKIFEEQKNIQPLNQRQLDSTMQGLERQKQYGLKTGGRVGYADGGGIDQLLQNLKGSFGQLNQQVAARPQPQAPANYQAMLGQATGQAPSDAYQRMLAQALNGKTYEGLFPKAAEPVKAEAPAPVVPVAPLPSYGDAAAADYSSWMTQILGDGGSGTGTGDGAAGGDSSGGAAGADGAGGDGGASSAGGGSAYRRGGSVMPTEAQKHAGNYQKRHLSFHGLPISIETPKGAAREGKSANGRTWRCTMPADYGYIKRTEGADGDHVDVYVGPDKGSLMVFVINQNDHRTGQFDEHKAMLGYSSERAAVSDYAKAFSDGKGHARIGSVEAMSLDAFKHWLKRGKTKTPAKSKNIIEHALAMTRRK